jgi:2'-5' RNA ligase
VNVTGRSLAELDADGAKFAARMGTEIKATLRSVTSEFGTAVTVDDLAPIRARWDQRVDRNLMPQVAAAYWKSVTEISRPLLNHMAARKGVTAAPSPAHDGPDPLADKGLADPGLPRDLRPAALGVAIARVPNTAAEQYLADARNRLVGVGDEIWEHARGELVTGMQAGEGISKLSVRVARVAAALAQPRAETIARTEVNGASNAGALEQVRALAVPATKTWVATEDERTREDHADADGQEVGLDEQFQVGGESMDRPHDETASASQTVNCRCTVSYSIPEDDVSDISEDAEVASITAAADQVMTGAMIALVPSPDDLDRLALPDGEPREELHLTLWFLGDAIDYDGTARQSLIANVESLFAGYGPIEAVAFGAACWNPTSDTPACVLNVGDPAENIGALNEAREVAILAMGAADFTAMPPQKAPWSPHICLAYGQMDMTVMDGMLKRVGPVTFDTLRIAFGGSVTDIALAG